MTALITGSYAYDTIMAFPDRFKNHILPEQVHILNVSFLAPEMRREFGGCAGNITYNLALLGAPALPMATVGEDFAPYRRHLREHGICDRHIAEIKNTHTAQAFLVTDLDNNQITAFHPGAMDCAQQNHVKDANGVTLGIVAPDGRAAMLQHAAEFAAAGIPFFFDPGQGLPMFARDELLNFINAADYVVVNDYESQMLRQKTELNELEIAAKVRAFIITRGGEGAEVFAAGERFQVDPIRVLDAHDPTGCGDAFRAGLIYGVQKNLDWKTSAQLGGVLGGVKIEHHGTQNHRPSKREIEARYKENFGESLRLE